jgi:hypothetical protein
MKVVIACDDQSLAAKIAGGLRQVGIDCPASQLLSLDSAQATVTGRDNRSLVVVFFGSQQFSSSELVLLKQLCDGSGPNLKVVAVGPANSPTVVLQAIHRPAAACSPRTSPPCWRNASHSAACSIFTFAAAI